MEEFIIHTDGGCSGNPGPGGWAYVMRYGDRLREDSGYCADTTNNRMELLAVIEALAYVDAARKARAAKTDMGPAPWLSAPVRVFTDSQYVRNGITAWVHRWKTKGWKTADGKPVKNEELWRRLDELVSLTEADFHWVEGHAGNPDNERCDSLVRLAITQGRSSEL